MAQRTAVFEKVGRTRDKFVSNTLKFDTEFSDRFYFVRYQVFIHGFSV